MLSKHRFCIGAFAKQSSVLASHFCKIFECRHQHQRGLSRGIPIGRTAKNISEQLKVAREKAGIDLAQVAAQTFIPQRLLKAMDEGKFERLPEPVFIQGFIRRYGDAVGLDGKRLAQEFMVQPPVLKKPAEEFLSYHPDDNVAPAPRNPRPLKLTVPPQPVASEANAPDAETGSVSPAANSTSGSHLPAANPPVSPVPAPKSATPANPGQSGDNRQLIYWVGGLSALALLVIGAIAVMQPKSGSDTDPAGSSASPTVSSPAPSPTPTVTPAAAPLTLSIKVTDDSWIEVITDGEVIVSEILPKGTQQTWTAQERLSITSGNARGVTFSYNQSPEKPMGTTANPETLIFPAQP